MLWVGGAAAEMDTGNKSIGFSGGTMLSKHRTSCSLLTNWPNTASPDRPCQNSDGKDVKPTGASQDFDPHHPPKSIHLTGKSRVQSGSAMTRVQPPGPPPPTASRTPSSCVDVRRKDSTSRWDRWSRSQSQRLGLAMGASEPRPCHGA